LETGRDLILFDQRGVGLSNTPLECPALRDLSLDLLDHEIDGQVLTEDEMYDHTLAAAQECHRLISMIADLSDYNTLSSASDVEDLRLTLGYEQVNLWGGSYGTRLALEMMRDYPEGIRSVVLDSVYPPDVNLNLEMPKNFLRSLNLLFDACAADEVCNQAYPDLGAVFFEAIAQLDENPVPLTLTHPFTLETYPALMTGDFLMAFMFQNLYFTDVLPILPQIIYDAHDGKFAMLEQIYSGLLIQTGVVSHGMQISVQCNEGLSFTTPDEYQTMLDDYSSVAELFDDSLFGKMGFEVCANWGAGKAAALEKQPVVSDLPTLVMAGEYDPITPPEWARHAAETLSNSYVFEFPGTGHGTSAKTLDGVDCGLQIMLDFIIDPSEEPDSSCIAGMGLEFIPPIDFAALEWVPVEVPDQGFSTVAPSDWNAVQPDYYISPDLTVELVFNDVRGQDLESFLSVWGAADAIDDLEINGLQWEIREISLAEYNIEGYVATSTHEKGFYTVLAITQPYQKLLVRDDVFFPVVEAFWVEGVSVKTAEPEDSEVIAEPEEESAPPEAEETEVPPEPEETPVAQEPEEEPVHEAVKLIPFESETFGIRGLAPEGWLNLQPGVFTRGSSYSDPTLLIQKSYPDLTTDGLLAALLPAMGIPELSEPMTEYGTKYFEWTLYQVEVEMPGGGTAIVDLALAERAEVPYLILLQAEAGEHNDQLMLEEIFLPAVDALVPIG
jgi:pimeloyl-ACP methyl ester carboxylesterase